MGSVLVMACFIKKVTYYKDAFKLKIAETPLGFLHQLKGLTIFDVQGKDISRTRVITTLIHGNEPSGFIALHHWLMENSLTLTWTLLNLRYSRSYFNPMSLSKKERHPFP